VKQLLLLRHAEAEPAAPGTRDFDRILTERGRLEALEAGEAIATVHLKIDEVLVSPAQRTRQTLAIVVGKLGFNVPTELVPTLYLASPDAMHQALQGCRSTSNTVLVVGHNPGISELAQQLSRATPGLTLRTAGACQLTFLQDSWDDLTEQRASTWKLLR
jgi:phosphohistidine phosphatase